MYAVGGVGDLGRVVGSAVMAGLLVSCVMGCDSDERAPGEQDGPYTISGVEWEMAEAAESWAPGKERVQTWFDEAIRESDRGLSTSGEGLSMTATVRHEATVEEREAEPQLVFEFETDLVEMTTKEDDGSALTLSTEAEFLHPLSSERPSDEVLKQVSRTLGRRAVEETVEQLRHQAQIRQGDPWELVRWTRTSSVTVEKRLLAMGELVRRQVEGSGPALRAAAQDESPSVAVEAAVALYELKSDDAAHVVMDVAQRMSRDEHYDEYLRLLSVVGKLDAPWVSIYLETVAQAHSDYRVRQKARSISAERPTIE